MTVAIPTRGSWDFTNIAAIPTWADSYYNIDIVFYYADGAYAIAESTVRNRFPNATLVSITVLGNPAMQMYDCEVGNGIPQTAVSYMSGRVNNYSKYGMVYCGQHTWWGAISNLINNAGLADNTNYFVASYDGDPTVPNGACGKQFANAPMLGFNADLSNWINYIPGIDAVPDPAPVLTENPMWQRIAYDAQNKQQWFAYIVPTSATEGVLYNRVYDRATNVMSQPQAMYNGIALGGGVDYEFSDDGEFHILTEYADTSKGTVCHHWFQTPWNPASQTRNWGWQTL